MQVFTIYPKGKSEPFNVECYRFKIKDGRFILYDSSDRESQEGFLSFLEIAAVIPDQRKTSYGEKPLSFLVYLKDKASPIEVFANTFKIDSDSRVVFITQQKDIMGNITNECPLDSVYVAMPEVIAIVPSDGLQSRR